jgi:hypothetical protein
MKEANNISLSFFFDSFYFVFLAKKTKNRKIKTRKKQYKRIKVHPKKQKLKKLMIEEKKKKSEAECF